jgi:hypothetical protein
MTFKKLMGIMIQAMIANNIPVALSFKEFAAMPLITTFPFNPIPTNNNVS